MISSVEFVVMFFEFFIELGFHEQLFLKGLDTTHRFVFLCLLIDSVLRDLNAKEHFDVICIFGSSEKEELFLLFDWNLEYLSVFL